MTTRRKTPEQRAAEAAAEQAGSNANLAAVPEATRGGEDTRRRGWFWHWNALVTQYAPLIGLKGVGLLNSYTVWTDRREESPHRGYAFPSQQSEADFYGEERAELITINKILVALDLIEIRKEMVLRVDPQGRRWKVPHNFYRVKDHGDDFTLTTPYVLRVAELAATDRAVYRYVRRVFSSRFSPIDGDNVWGRILPEVRQTPVWQELAARAEAEETRASARTRAGHAARKGSANPGNDADFFVPGDGDDAATTEPVNDSDAVTMEEERETSVASINTGSSMDVAATNRGSRSRKPGDVAASNEGAPTSVAPTNTTYDQSRTTTKRPVKNELAAGATMAPAQTAPQAAQQVVSDSRPLTTGGPGAVPPVDAAAQLAATRAFEQANDRAATPAERKLLRDLAERYEPVAQAAATTSDADVPGSGWGWLEAAVWEAVEAGSAFVAPRRLREILQRWERDGFPGAGGSVGVAASAPAPAGASAPMRAPARTESRPAPIAAAEWTAPANRVEAPVPAVAEPVNFPVAEMGLGSRQVWAAALDEVARQGRLTRTELETWLRPASLTGRDGATLLLGAPNAVARDRIAARLLPAVRAAIAATVGVELEIEVVVADDAWEQRAAGD
ncbi:MAG: hypothetical protein QM692_04525 [Thermomicrobiales bacterium]